MSYNPVQNRGSKYPINNSLSILPFPILPVCKKHLKNQITEITILFVVNLSDRSKNGILSITALTARLTVQPEKFNLNPIVYAISE